ncbi:MAG: DNA polymerase III subunit delta, partial [Brucellaceae bacterium]|nr:DNA polymerase III subunit delta [Brucellaceae bacterium]
KPPVFYSRKVVVERAISLWPLASIARALERLQAAVFTSRQHGDLEEEAIRQALLALALESKARARD